MRAESLGGLQDNQCPSDMYLCSIPFRDEDFKSFGGSMPKHPWNSDAHDADLHRRNQMGSQFGLYQLDQYTSVQS